MTTPDYYQVLQVSPTASEREIKQAYRDLVRKYHPDTSDGNDSRLLFQRVTEAYNFLSDPERRRDYDLSRGINSRAETLFSNRFKEPASAHKVNPAADNSAEMQNFRSRHENTSKNLFESKGSSEVDEGGVRAKLKNLYDAYRGTKEEKPEAAKLRGKRFYQFTIDGLEAITGTTREIALGTPDDPVVIPVGIPAGTTDGTVIEIPSGTKKGGKQEVIELTVNVTPHPMVESEGDNIILTVPITIGEALLGVEVSLPTEKSSITVKIPPKMDLRKKLRVKGRGLKVPHSDQRGDLLIRTSIAYPDQDSAAIQQAAQAIDDHYLGAVRKKFPAELKRLLSE